MILRAAVPDDAEQMCDLLNEIIGIGGTTAHRRTFDVARMTRHYITAPRLVSITVAVDAGRIIGFQSLEWSDPNWQGDGFLPPDWGIIATFVRVGITQKGTGTALFRESERAARATSMVTIDATIRIENTGGQRYYSRMGFQDYKRSPETVSKRFDP